MFEEDLLNVITGYEFKRAIPNTKRKETVEVEARYFNNAELMVIARNDSSVRRC